MWSRKWLALALSVLVAMTTLVSAQPSSALAQLEPAPTDPELFDLELAQANLDAIETEANRLRAELGEALDQIDGLTIKRDFIELNDKGRNDLMQQSRNRARNMAINAYIGIGPPLSGVVVLDAEDANDLSYRNGLLRQQAERLKEAADLYQILVGEADASVLAIADNINDETRRAEAINRALNHQMDQLEQALWVVSIAEIHREADEAFEKSRRAEPSAEQWRQLRFCESTETYSVDSGNTFYGAYQFTWDTWGTVGGSDNPAHAPPAEQDARARLLFARRGAQPWPICGRFLR
jgi:hypothetical protein